MPRVRFSGPLPAAAPGQPLFQPDEVREVGPAAAAYLLRNVHFALVPDEGPEADQPTPEPAAPEPEPPVVAGL